MDNLFGVRCRSLSLAFRRIFCFDSIPMIVYILCEFFFFIYINRCLRFFDHTRFARHIFLCSSHSVCVLIEHWCDWICMRLHIRAFVGGNRPTQPLSRIQATHRRLFITNSNAQCSMLIRVRFCNFVHNGKSLCFLFFSFFLFP